MQKTRLIMVGALAAALSVAGCANMSETQRGTATGAGIGALAGAVLGGVTGPGGGSRAAGGAALGAAAGALGGYIWSQHMQQQKTAMEQATAGTGVTVSQTADNQLKLDIPSDISFDTNSAVIKPNMRPILDRFAEGLRTSPNAHVRIIGHTDSTGTDAINNPLSINRAASTRDYLVARGVPVTQIAIDGMGSRQPVASNATAEGRAKNRRVEIYMGEVAAQQ